MKTFLFLFLFLALALTACTPNRSIALDNHTDVKPDNDNSSTNSNAAAEPPKKITIAELIERVASAPPDSFLFPCTLNAYSDDDRAKLRKLKQQWLSKEKDGRYLVSSATGCVCPGICVLAVEDTQAAAPKNFALLALDGFPVSKFSWVIKDADLSNVNLTWSGTIPYLNFKNPDGTDSGKKCSVELDTVQGLYKTNCADGNGKKLPPLDAE